MTGGPETIAAVLARVVTRVPRGLCRVTQFQSVQLRLMGRGANPFLRVGQTVL